MPENYPALAPIHHHDPYKPSSEWFHRFKANPGEVETAARIWHEQATDSLQVFQSLPNAQMIWAFADLTALLQVWNDRQFTIDSAPLGEFLEMWNAVIRIQKRRPEKTAKKAMAVWANEYAEAHAHMQVVLHRAERVLRRMVLASVVAPPDTLETAPLSHADQPVVCMRDRRVFVNGVEVPLNMTVEKADDTLAFLQHLLTEPGNWFSSAEIGKATGRRGVRFDILYKKLPKQLKSQIKSCVGKGFALRIVRN